MIKREEEWRGKKKALLGEKKIRTEKGWAYVTVSITNYSSLTILYYNITHDTSLHANIRDL